MNFQDIIKQKEYDFLRTNEHLGDNIILLGLGGSYAYGTNVETSDVDIRGVAIERPEEIIGYQHFEQVINEATDTTIYAFNKMVELLVNNNPNIVEILGLKPEHYLYVSPLGKELLEHKDLFLSQKCFYTFGGYARAQLKRLENALARDNYPEDRKNEHIAISLMAAIDAFNSQHKTDINPAFAYVNDAGELRYKLDMDISSGDLESFYAAVSNTTKNYKELLNRNRKKDINHLAKHCMHLVRLILTCINLLQTGDIHTYCENDHELLMAIRNGYYFNAKGELNQDFYVLVNSLEQELNRALCNSSLQKEPNRKEIEKWVMDVNKRIINGQIQNYNILEK